MKVVLQDYKYGRIMRPAGDYYIGDCIAMYGEYCENEIDVYRHIVKSGDVVLDIGANIGACTVPLAQMTGAQGRVYSFEPQRVIFQMLCGNVMLNNLMNVYTYNACIGSSPGNVKINDLYLDAGTSTFNTGSFAVEKNPGTYEVRIMTVDGLNLSRCNFIKCDTEGMGLEMLQGAQETVKACSPVLYIEREEGDKGKEIVKLLKQMKYRVLKHDARIFNSNNYFGDIKDIYQNFRRYPVVEAATCFNWLCVPENFPMKVNGNEENIDTMK